MFHLNIINEKDINPSNDDSEDAEVFKLIFRILHLISG